MLTYKYLKIITIILFMLTGYVNAAELPKAPQRILVLGDSITYQGGYVSYLESYLTLQKKQQYQFINVGLPSETVSGLSEQGHAKGKFPRPDLHERLSRILQQTKPDYILVCYGMNDGIYQPFNNQRFAQYQQGIQWLNTQLEPLNVPIIYITPPVYDPLKDPAYGNVVNIYANWLISKRYTDHWQVIDTFNPMQYKLDHQRATLPTFTFSRDGIHPNKQGHWQISKSILAYYNIDIDTNSLDFSNVASTFKHGNDIAKLINKKQLLLRDAWLSATQHLRPNIKAGLPLIEAQQQARVIDKQIALLLNDEK